MGLEEASDKEPEIWPNLVSDHCAFKESLNEHSPFLVYSFFFNHSVILQNNESP